MRTPPPPRSPAPAPAPLAPPRAGAGAGAALVVSFDLWPPSNILCCSLAYGTVVGAAVTVSLTHLERVLPVGDDIFLLFVCRRSAFSLGGRMFPIMV